MIPLLFLSLYLFQILNMVYFSIKERLYIKGGLIFICVQTLSFMFLRMFIRNKRRDDKVKLMHLEQYMYSESDGQARQAQTEEKTLMDSTLSDEKAVLIPKSTAYYS